MAASMSTRKNCSRDFVNQFFVLLFNFFYFVVFFKAE